MAENTNQVATATKNTVYKVNGEEVTLNANIVRQFLTKGNAQVTDQEIMQFIGICKYNEMNPFTGDAYLVKYNSKDGSGNAQMIISRDAFFKRADSCPNYDGIQSGVIVKTAEGKIVDVEGCFVDPTDTLIGGWAKVYRSDRKFPFVCRENLSEYDKGKSIWVEKKSTMINKVAEAHALKKAFPNQLSSYYIPDDEARKPVEDAEYRELKDEKAENANQQELGFDENKPTF